MWVCPSCRQLLNHQGICTHCRVQHTPQTALYIPQQLPAQPVLQTAKKKRPAGLLPLCVFVGVVVLLSVTILVTLSLSNKSSGIPVSKESELYLPDAEQYVAQDVAPKFPMSGEYYVDTADSFLLRFNYAAEEPLFEFVSPSGIVYREGSANLQVERKAYGGFGSIFYLFEVGEVGDWLFRYNQFSNDDLGFVYEAYTHETVSTAAPSPTSPPKPSPKPVTTPRAVVSYKTIYDEYVVKLRDATLTLVSEYKAEAGKNTSGLEGLARILNAKIEKLAVVLNEGISAMADHMWSGSSGKYSEYEEWAGKLWEVYEYEADKIWAVYMKSAE